ncbi:hypothetical protein M0805_003127 [Coniferiporia weirii]|nr:hypothetical protein M0805_003127 [Coniferiporia weirii]
MFKSAYLVSFLALAQLASAQLDAIAKLSGKKYFGSATDNPELTDKPYVEILSDILEFGQLTPGNSMKWDATEPEQGTFNFTGGQQIVDLAHRNGQIIRGHNCVWYSQLPGWVTAGNFSASELTSIVENHCGTIVGHWSDAWDVINEPFNDDGTWRSDVFYDTLGQDFVPIALKAAYNADKKAKLYINDYNIEGESAKATAMINLVKQLKADGVPINGVGLQSHFIVGEVPTTIQQNMEAMVALGIEVAITELDIRMTLPATEALLEQQAKDYESVISACHAVPGCIGVTIWDYTDKYSWVPASFPGQGAACPWDQNLKKKLAYGGIIAGFL